MERRFCGIDLGGILEGIRPNDPVRAVATYVLEEALTGVLPCHVLRDDGAPAVRACLLILGRLGQEIYFVSIDSQAGVRSGAPDLSIEAIRNAVAAIPDGKPGRGQMRRVLASPHAAAGMLMIAESAAGAINCAFARNPALARDEAERLLKAYFTKTVESWSGNN